MIILGCNNTKIFSNFTAILVFNEGKDFIFRENFKNNGIFSKLGKKAKIRGRHTILKLSY